MPRPATPSSLFSFFSFFFYPFCAAFLIYYFLGYRRSHLLDSISTPNFPFLMSTLWYQTSVTLKPRDRGCHLITSELNHSLKFVLYQFECGLAHFFIQHTSASLCINENFDPDVRKDTEMLLNRLVPENLPYSHSDEGPDDMPAHFKSVMIGPSLTIPIQHGQLALGRWQGIWLCEHRNDGGRRSIVITLQGKKQ